ncbi:MAG: ABC transporter permease [bacterium]|nr:ABC transporter permease [bacterium]
MRLLLRQGFRHHWRNPLPTLLTLLGIAAGVALLTAMRASQGTAERAFDRAVDAVTGAATHAIVGGPDGLPATSYGVVRAMLRGRGVAPSIHAIARVPDREERTVLRVLGVDPFGDVELRPWSGPRAGDVPVGRLVTEPGGFVATAELLRRLGLAVGTELDLSVGGRLCRARCLGTIAPPANVAAGLRDTLVVDIATAQEWTGRLDRIDRLDLRLAARGLSDETLVQRAVAACGGLARLERVGRGGRSLAQLTQGFRVNVTAMSLLSLLVGAFLVHETMRLSVVARRRSFGVLRALGTKARALGLVVALEALLLGILGSALGVAFGVVAAGELLTPIVRTLNDHYATFGMPVLDLDPWQLTLAGLAGVTVTVVAAAAPAVAAARVSPREVLVTANAGAAAQRSPRLLRAVGWSLPPALLGALLLVTVGDRLVQGYLGMFFVLAAAVALTPPAMELLLRFAARVVARLGPFARYVVRSTASARGHLALPVAAMVLAVATTIGMAVLVTSFRGSVASWLGQVLPGDVYVSIPGGVDERDQPIDDAIVAACGRVPGIVGRTLYRRARLELATGEHRGEIEVVGIEASAAYRAAWPFLAGDAGDVGTGIDAAVAWVSEPLAFRWGLQVGDELTIVAPLRDAKVRVAALYRDYANERGEVIVDATWFAGIASVGVTAMGFEASDGGDPEQLAAAVRAAAAEAAPQNVIVRSQRDLRETSLAIFDRTFAITGVMRLLCLAVAFFGIYSAFSSLQFERAREIGLLRCLGAVPSRIGVVVIGQTVLLGVIAAALAIPLGLVIGQLLAHVINRVSFGWSLVEVTVPGGALVEAAVLAVVAASLAGIWPAVRFARMRPARALQEG